MYIFNVNFVLNDTLFEFIMDYLIYKKEMKLIYCQDDDCNINFNYHKILCENCNEKKSEYKYKLNFFKNPKIKKNLDHKYITHHKNCNIRYYKCCDKKCYKKFGRKIFEGFIFCNYCFSYDSILYNDKFINFFNEKIFFFFYNFNNQNDCNLNNLFNFMSRYYLLDEQHINFSKNNLMNAIVNLKYNLDYRYKYFKYFNFEISK